MMTRRRHKASALAAPLKNWSPLLTNYAAARPSGGGLAAYYVLSEVDAFIWNAKYTGVFNYPNATLQTKMCAYRPTTDSGLGSNLAEKGEYLLMITKMKENEMVKKFMRDPSLEVLCRPFSCRLMGAVAANATAAARRNQPRGTS
jgi:hypothetical protein